MRTGKPTLISLALETGDDFQQNLDRLKALCDTAPTHSIILAPEVTVTGFYYDRFEEAALFSQTIDLALLQSSQNDKTIITTLVEKEYKDFYNIAKVYHNGNIIYTQKKHKLFPLGNEDLHFHAGSDDAIRIFEIDGMKIGILICFELRFTKLWEQLKGADIILVPAQWGKARAEHFLTLTKALAICNQCYVVASDASNSTMSAGSGIITPFGEEERNGDRISLSRLYESESVKKMRRYINIGIPLG